MSKSTWNRLNGVFIFCLTCSYCKPSNGLLNYCEYITMLATFTLWYFFQERTLTFIVYCLICSFLFLVLNALQQHLLSHLVYANFAENICEWWINEVIYPLFKLYCLKQSRDSRHHCQFLELTFSDSEIEPQPFEGIKGLCHFWSVTLPTHVCMCVCIL